jgi:hypothetical protein
MQKKNSKAVLLLGFYTVFLAACTTTIRIQVEQPPVLNTSGIRRIAVMPFGSSGGTANREIAQYITSVAANNIRALNHFTLINSSVITQLQRNNESIEGHVDALFNGRITYINTNDSSTEVERKDKDDNVYMVTIYTREVEMEFNYSFTRARDGILIGPVTKRGKKTSVSEDLNTLLSTAALARSIVDEQLRNINRDVVPYTITESRTLIAEQSKDKELKAIMKDILTLVRSGIYRSALDSYLRTYSVYKNIAAAVNASILYEALGETQTAANFMSAVYGETGNIRIINELARLNRILANQALIAAEYRDARSQIEKTADYAVDEIQKVLSVNTMIWIYNNSSGNTMAEAVVDNITAGFIRKGIGLVDRDNLDLIEAEQNFHLSGLVSDSDFVSIGNAAGANTIVIISVTGTGDMRRLQLRVLDIEKGIPILQSDTSDAWKL